MAMNDTSAAARGTGTTSTTTTTGMVQRAGALSAVDWIALVLVIVGGLNWGLVGLFNFDLVAAIFGTMTVASRAVYTLVGLAALYCIYLASRVQTKP